MRSLKDKSHHHRASTFSAAHDTYRPYTNLGATGENDPQRTLNRGEFAADVRLDSSVSFVGSLLRPAPFSTGNHRLD
jgi:hypothetical protein